jgi:hypothetical protein
MLADITTKASPGGCQNLSPCLFGIRMIATFQQENDWLLT